MIAARKRARYANIRDAERRRVHAYGKTNPHKSWERHYRQRARRYGFEPVVETFTRADVIARYGDQCAHCGGPFEELDHYPVPVSQGGPHTLHNTRRRAHHATADGWKPPHDHGRRPGPDAPAAVDDPDRRPTHAG